MKVEVLHIDDCPTWQDGLRNLLDAMVSENLPICVDLVLVKDDDQAESLKFLGSPSFRIDGRDLWPEERQNFKLNCRIYSTPEGLVGVPSVEMLRERIRATMGDGQKPL
jgi:hypothetical protein